MLASEISPPPPPPPAPAPGTPSTANGRNAVIVAAILGGIAVAGLALMALAGLLVSTTVDRGVETTTTERSGCFNREGASELCFSAANGVVTITGHGLMPGSLLTLTGDDGSFVESAVGQDGLVAEEVSGTIVHRSFTLEGTWADGQAVVLTSDTEERSGE